MKRPLIFAVLLLLSSASPLTAEVFQFQDEEGRIHFVDDLEKIPPKYRKVAEQGKSLPPISRIEPGRKRLYEADRYRAPAEIEVFVTESCPYSRQLEAFLRQERLPYKRYDIERDPQGRRLHAALGKGVPMTRIGNTVIRGFHPQRIKAALRSR